MKEEQKQQQQPSPEKYEAEMQNALRGYISGTGATIRDWANGGTGSGDATKQ